ncbi:PAS domain S-box protein [Thioalkalivibrio sp. ALE21]|uniref:PAS domain-containing sensor histidine kinase n=1 Tax=Thioalkalivibrio sp. ALE21 TaxID=1158175 RepID=UPI001FF0C9E0|nr:PAS domain S-box protein [Thioalkalivibrio sp. ALE21]
MAELAALSPDRRPIFGGQHAMDPENTHSAFFEHAPVGMAVVDADGCLRAANRRLSGLLAREADVLVGQTLTQWVASAEADRVAAAIHSLTYGETGEWRDECRLLPRQGPPLWVELALSRLPDADDGAARLALTATDIDARKASEAERDELEHFYQQTFTNNVAVKLLIDPDDGRIVDANPAAETFYGWSIEELKKRPIQAINTLSAEEVRTEMERAAEEERLYFRFRHRVASGEIRDVEVYSGPVWLRGKRYLHSIIHDATDTRRYLRELERYKAIFDTLPVGVYRNLPGHTGQFDYVNPAMARIFGAGSIAELLSRSTAELYTDPEERRRFSDDLLARGEVHRRELDLRTLDGRAIRCAITARAHETEQGTVFDGVVEDVTERHQAERQREDLLQILEAAPDFIGMADPDGRILYQNPSFNRAMGFADSAEASLHDVGGLHPEWARRRLQEEALPEARHNGIWQGEMAILAGDGRELPVSQTVVAHFDETGAVRRYSTIIRDISERVATEQALRQREAELNQAQRIARMGSWVSDFRVNEIRWSDEIYRIFGRRPEEGRVTHETFMEAVHPHDRTAVRAALEASFAGEPYDIVHRVVRSDGEVRTVRERGHTEFDDTGQPIRMLGTVQDITEQRQLEDSLRRLVSILDSTPDVVSMHGPDGAMLYLNAAGRRLMGLPEPELTDHWDPQTGWNRTGLPREMDTVEGTIERVHPPWALERVRTEALPAAMEQGAWQGETALLDAEGRERPASQVLLVHHDADGAIAQTSTIIRDISERKRIERELERSNAELEQFAYAVSHDLQEPLRIINSYLGLLERRHADALDDKARRYIDTATDAAGRMRQMIQDLLEYSRVQRMGEAFAPVDLARALDDACGNLHTAIQDSGARISRDPLPTVQGDAGQLMRLFQNLLSNAIKYGPPDAVPEIHVGCDERGDEWEIRVTDNGIGIDPEQSERIFQVFQRLHGRAEYPGTGAGLALARRITERHGGRIRAESDGEGHGTTFRLTLPRQPADATSAS